MTQEARTAAKGIYHLFLGNSMSTALLAVTSIIVVRILGPSNYGLYSISLIIPSYLSTLFIYSIPWASVRFPAKYKAEGLIERSHSFLSSMVLVQLITSIVAVLVMIPLSSFFSSTILGRPSLAVLIPIALFSVVGQALFYTSTSGFQGLEDMRSSSLLQVLQATTKLVVSVLLILTGFEITGAVIGYGASYLVSGIIGLILILSMKRESISNKWTHDLKQAFIYSAPILPSVLVSGLAGVYQITLLSNYVSSDDIGGYGATLSILAVMALITYPVTSALFPLFSKVSSNNVRLAQIYSASIRYISILIVPAIVFLILFSSQILLVIFGKEFVFGYGMLIGLALTFVFVGLGELSWPSLLSGSGKTKAYFSISLLGSVATVIVSTFGVFYFGVYGVIIGTITGKLVSCLVSLIYFNKTYAKINLFSGIWKIYFASVLTSLPIYPLTLLHLNDVLVLGLGIVSFLLILIPVFRITGAVNDEDIDFLKQSLANVSVASRIFQLVIRYYRMFPSLSSK